MENSVLNTDSIGESVEMIFNELNETYPNRRSENKELIDMVVSLLDNHVGNYYPECLIGKHVHIYSEIDGIGTENPDDVCIINDISVIDGEIKHLLCYVETNRGFNHTRFFSWDKCKDYIKVI